MQGYLVNRVWPREKNAKWNLDVIFFEGNVGGRQGLSCRDTWLQRYVPRVCWPRDWLPEDIKTDIRVLMLEYCISDKGIAGLVNDIKKHLIFRCELQNVYMILSSRKVVNQQRFHLNKQIFLNLLSNKSLNQLSHSHNSAHNYQYTRHITQSQAAATQFTLLH